MRQLSYVRLVCAAHGLWRVAQGSGLSAQRATVTDTGRHLGLHQTQGKIQSTFFKQVLFLQNWLVLVLVLVCLFGLVWCHVMMS